MDSYLFSKPDWYQTLTHSSLGNLDFNSDFQTYFMAWYIEHFLRNCTQVNATEPRDARQQAISWTNIDPDLCHHMASQGHVELTD